MGSRASGSSSAVVLEEPAVISFAAIPSSVQIVPIESGTARSLDTSEPIPVDGDHRGIRAGDRDGNSDRNSDAAEAAQKLRPHGRRANYGVSRLFRAALGTRYYYRDHSNAGHRS